MDDNKKIIIVVLIGVMIVGIFFGISLGKKQNGNENNNQVVENKTNEDKSNDIQLKDVSIRKYDYKTQNDIINVKIDSDDDLKKCQEFCKELKVLSDNEMVELALLDDVCVTFNDSISVKIQLEQPKYCYYENKEKNISGLAKMPSGLYDWVITKI